MSTRYLLRIYSTLFGQLEPSMEILHELFLFFGVLGGALATQSFSVELLGLEKRRVRKFYRNGSGPRRSYGLERFDDFDTKIDAERGVRPTSSRSRASACSSSSSMRASSRLLALDAFSVSVLGSWRL